MIEWSDKIVWRADGPIGHIIFNNPERHNAMSLAMWKTTEQAIHRLVADETIRVIILSGAGDKAFISGADISKFEDERASTEAVNRYNAATASTFDALSECRKPTIAQINGFCLGGGLGLALCCDIRVCSDDAKFAIPAAKLGIGYDPRSVKRLLDTVGPAFAKDILFTGRHLDAEEADRMGIVNRVVSRDSLEADVKRMSELIAANAPLSIAASKAAVVEWLKPESERDLDRCAALAARCFTSDDYEEGRKAFLEKRKPHFRGH